MNENNWLTSMQAAKYLGVTPTYFRRTIIKQMQEMELEGMGKLSNARNSAWRFKVESLDRYMARDRVQLLQGA